MKKNKSQSQLKKILITDRFAQDSFLYLQAQPHFEVLQSEHPQNLPLHHLIDCHALIIRSRTRIESELLKKAKNLQVIITATSGFDHIDLEATSHWGITVMHTPNANIECAAQLTWALILACSHQLQPAMKMTQSGHWQREKIIGLELFQKTLGIVGLGRIGGRVAQIAQAFQMNVIAYDPYIEDSQFKKFNVQKSSYHQVLQTSDVICFHVPKTQETELMLQKPQLDFMKPTAILVNTSRGSLLNENDLIQHIQQEKIRAVGLDVFQIEPLPEQSELLQFKNVMTTPHIGANSEDAFYKASQIAAYKLVSFFLDGSTSDTLPPRAAWYGAFRN